MENRITDVINSKQRPPASAAKAAGTCVTSNVSALTVT